MATAEIYPSRDITMIIYTRAEWEQIDIFQFLIKLDLSSQGLPFV